jgi:hypothetical protein
MYVVHGLSRGEKPDEITHARVRAGNGGKLEGENKSMMDWERWMARAGCKLFNLLYICTHTATTATRDRELRLREANTTRRRSRHKQSTRRIAERASFSYLGCNSQARQEHTHAAPGPLASLPPTSSSLFHAQARKQAPRHHHQHREEAASRAIMRE